MAIRFFSLCWSGFSLFVIFILVWFVIPFHFFLRWFGFGLLGLEGRRCVQKKRDDDGVRVFVAEMARVPTERVFVAKKEGDDESANREGFLLRRRKAMCAEKRRDDDVVRVFAAGDQSI
uniref:Transmembrane protein n=1 Tax=Picea sitchensis TaxID=3332 RepID=D5AB71_PICSI|nr:unknown [Picea sitchensis]